jgi:hypothetical protein
LRAPLLLSPRCCTSPIGGRLSARGRHHACSTAIFVPRNFHPRLSAPTLMHPGHEQVAIAERPLKSTDFSKLIRAARFNQVMPDINTAVSSLSLLVLKIYGARGGLLEGFWRRHLTPFNSDKTKKKDGKRPPTTSPLTLSWNYSSIARFYISLRLFGQLSVYSYIPALILTDPRLRNNKATIASLILQYLRFINTLIIITLDFFDTHYSIFHERSNII